MRNSVDKNMNSGDKLKVFVKDRMTQKRLAMLMNVEQATISRYFKSPTVDTVKRVVLAAGGTKEDVAYVLLPDETTPPKGIGMAEPEALYNTGATKTIDIVAELKVLVGMCKEGYLSMSEYEKLKKILIDEMV